MKIYVNIYNQIISPENLFLAWDEFKKGKLKKSDVLILESHLEKNIFELHRDLKYHNYKHSVYYSFTITDPKQRKIHKATVRDRVLHHAIFRILNPIFESTFVSDSFSCRIGKGNHRGSDRLVAFIRKVSKNYTQPCFVLKCDIKKFFDSIDHQILIKIIKRKIKDADLYWLMEEIIGSFGTDSEPQTQLGLFRERERERERERPSAANTRGIPIGNLTSQLFANVYMNEFDQFIKQKLNVKYYCRYTDDFVIVSCDHDYLEKLLPRIQLYLRNELKLYLHPNKVSIRKIRQGIDFLGYVVLPYHRQLRTKTKRRIFNKLKQRIVENKSRLIDKDQLNQSLNSFLGVLSHADSHKTVQELLNQFWFWLKE